MKKVFIEYLKATWLISVLAFALYWFLYYYVSEKSVYHAFLCASIAVVFVNLTSILMNLHHFKNK